MKILIVDDTFGYRRLLRRVLEAQLDHALVLEASNSEDGFRLVQQFKPNVVLVNVDMFGTDIDGLEATRRIKDGSGGAAVLILSTLDSDAYRSRAAECGADLYLPKAASIFEIVVAIRQIRPTKAV